MKRVAVKFDLKKLQYLGFEIYSKELLQANDLGFLNIYDFSLLSTNEDLYVVHTLYFKEKNVVKFKIEFYEPYADCYTYNFKLRNCFILRNRSLTKINANNIDYDLMMFKLAKNNLLEIVEDIVYV